MKRVAAFTRWLPGMIMLVALGILYRSSLLSMWRTWGESETYAHGYLVFPIVAFLIWRKRRELQYTAVKPWLPGGLLLAGLGLCWMVGHLLSVQVVEQLVFIAMGLVLVLAMYGWQVFKVILFPLVYMGFAVPMGEVLVPYLMEFTADFTVAALKVSGIPVYRDGMLFTIPSGDFEVATACSGIRYLMASFSLGTLYAYLSYRSFKKQVIFCVASLIVPIIANAIRAYGIVIIAHLSNMKYAVGVDHLIYGWLFFGLVMFLLFYVGGRFRTAEDFDVVPEVPSETASADRHPFVGVFVAVMVALLIPMLLLGRANITAQAEIAAPQLPLAQAQWRGPLEGRSGFRPELSDAEYQVSARYAHSQGEVQLWVYRYRPFAQGKEMINETNKLVSSRDWRPITRDLVYRADTGYLPVVNENLIKFGFSEYLVWHWYQINETTAASKIRGKLLEAWSWIFGGLDLDESIVVLAVKGRGEDERKILEDFVRRHGTVLRDCIYADSGSERCGAGYSFD